MESIARLRELLERMHVSPLWICAIVISIKACAMREFRRSSSAEENAV